MHNDPRTRYRHLYVYLGGVLHPDWDDDYASPDEAFDDYLSQAGGSDLKQFVGDLDDVLHMSDTELRAVVGRLSTQFDPRKDRGWDEREWLTSLRERARVEMEKRHVGTGVV